MQEHTSEYRALNGNTTKKKYENESALHTFWNPVSL